MLARFRAWGEADDGQPVYMLNLMRYYDQLKRLPGVDAMQGTPAQANAHYESVVTPIALRLGAIPLVNGEVAGVGSGDGRLHSNLITFDREVDDWNRVLVMRYPNRRAFFDLISDPAYLDVMPYKLASLKVALGSGEGRHRRSGSALDRRHRPACHVPRPRLAAGIAPSLTRRRCPEARHSGASNPPRRPLLPGGRH